MTSSTKENKLRTLLLSAFKVGLFGIGGGGNLTVIRELFVEKHKICTRKTYENAYGLTWLLPGPVATKLITYLAYRHYPKIWLPPLIILCFMIPGFILFNVIYLVGKSFDQKTFHLITATISFAFMYDFCFNAIATHIKRYRRFITTSIFIVLGSFFLSLLVSQSIIQHILIYLFAFMVFRVFGRFQSKSAVLLTDPLVWISLLQTGLLVYGGAYGMVAHLYKEWVEKFHLISPDTFWHAVGLGHMVPGPMMNFISYIGISFNQPLVAFAQAFILLTPPCMLNILIARNERFLLRNKNIKLLLRYFFPYIVTYILLFGLRLAHETFDHTAIIGVLLSLAVARFVFKLKFFVYMLITIAFGIAYAIWSLG